MTNVAFVALACGVIIGLGAIGACIGIALWAANTWKLRLVSLN